MSILFKNGQGLELSQLTTKVFYEMIHYFKIIKVVLLFTFSCSLGAMFAYVMLENMDMYLLKKEKFQKV